jgi:CheY-like chemotaxis protein
MDESREMILLAEDNPRDVELTLSILSDCNFSNKVVVSIDGVEALDYLYCRGQFASRTQGNPVLVVLDLKMPKVNGMEVLRQMRIDEALKRVPVILLTSARKGRESTKTGFMGANVYLEKPLDVHDFLEAAIELGLYWGITNKPKDEGNYLSHQLRS